jgi:hypothetical protein
VHSQHKAKALSVCLPLSAILGIYFQQSNYCRSSRLCSPASPVQTHPPGSFLTPSSPQHSLCQALCPLPWESQYRLHVSRPFSSLPNSNSQSNGKVTAKQATPEISLEENYLGGSTGKILNAHMLTFLFPHHTHLTDKKTEA